MSRRLVRVQIAQQLVEQILTTGYEITRPARCIDGLPAGARLVDVSAAMNGPFCDAVLTFEHESFADVATDTEPPFLTPIFQYADVAAAIPAPDPEAA